MLPHAYDTQYRYSFDIGPFLLSLSDMDHDHVSISQASSLPKIPHT